MFAKQLSYSNLIHNKYLKFLFVTSRIRFFDKRLLMQQVELEVISEW